MYLLSTYYERNTCERFSLVVYGTINLIYFTPNKFTFLSSKIKWKKDLSVLSSPLVRITFIPYPYCPHSYLLGGLWLDPVHALRIKKPILGHSKLMLFGGKHNVWTVIKISTKWRNRVSLTKWFEAFKLSYNYLSKTESYTPRRMSILERLLLAPVGVSGLQRLCYYGTPVPTQTHPSILLLRGSSFPVEEKGSYRVRLFLKRVGIGGRIKC